MTVAIKLITFDLDNTLWENDSVIARAEKTCYRLLQQHASKLTDRYSPEQLVELRMKLMAENPQLSSQVSKVRKLSIQRALESVDHDSASIPDLVAKTFDCFLQERSKVELFPHAIPLLKSLQKEYQLASLTNGNSDLQKIGIADYFSFSLSAEKVGASKPRPNIFQAALYKADAKPHETIHIGDHHLDDVFGAQQLGIHTIWFNPQKHRWEDRSTHNAPTATVHCLSEVVSAIEKIR